MIVINKLNMKSRDQAKLDVKHLKLIRKENKVKKKLLTVKWKSFCLDTKEITKKHNFIHINNIENSYRVSPKLSHFKTSTYGTVIKQEDERAQFFNFVLKSNRVYGFAMGSYVYLSADDDLYLSIYYFDYSKYMYNKLVLDKTEWDILKIEYKGRVGIEAINLNEIHE
jgi:hypothetical protein